MQILLANLWDVLTIPFNSTNVIIYIPAACWLFIVAIELFGYFVRGEWK